MGSIGKQFRCPVACGRVTTHSLALPSPKYDSRRLIISFESTAKVLSETVILILHDKYSVVI